MAENPEFEIFECSASDGLRLGGRLYGKNNHKHIPVICLPGIARNCLDFHNLAVFLSSELGGNHRVLALDYRGRGLSEYDKDWRNYSIFKEAEDVISAVNAAAFRHVNIVGTSRGGLIAMILGAIRPAMLRSVVLNDIGPVLEGSGMLRIRNALENYRSPASWEDAEEEFVRNGQLYFPSLSEDQWKEEAHRVFEMANGKLVPRHDRKLVNTLLNINFDFRLPDMWPQFAGITNNPVMVIRGEKSDLFSMETLETMTALHPNIQVEHVAGQGHAPRIGTAGLPEKISKFLRSTS